MLTTDGWFDWALRIPGPAEKVYSTRNTAEWFLPHSAVGFYGGWANRLFSMDRRADGRFTAYASASIHGWNAYDGTFTQHYPITASCWGSGSLIPNTRGVAIENEGGAPGNEGESLRPGQVDTIVRILQDMAAFRGVGSDYWKRPASASDKSATLYEHRECVRFGSEPTACPSGRIPWQEILRRLGGDEVFIPWSKYASLSLAPGDVYHNLRDNLALPAESNDWQFQFFTAYGGKVQVYHGRDRALLAGECRYSDSMRVQLDDAGGMWFSGASSTDTVGVLAVGYYT